MRYIASVHAYDARGHVVVTGTVRRYEGATNPTRRVILHRAAKFPGKGETDAALWLAEALLQLRLEL